MNGSAARGLSIALCAWIVLTVPGLALGRVIPNRCVGGIGLWDSRERVAREWGLPIRVTRSEPDVVWGYPNAKVLLAGSKRNCEPTRNRWIVLGITTTDPASGSSASASARGEVRSMPQSTLRTAAAVHVGARSCTLVYTEHGGMRETSVSLRHNRVTELVISTYSDYDDGPLQYADKRCRSTR